MGRATSFSTASVSRSWSRSWSSSSSVAAGDVDRGADLHHGVELDRAVLLPLGHVQLGRRDGLDLGGRDRARVVVGEELAHRLVAQRPGAPDPRLHDLARGLAGSEPRDADLARQRLRRGGDRRVHLVDVELDGDLDLVVLEEL
jgi:hypothetical protein